MKQEQAAAAEEIEARKSSDGGEHDETNTNHGENSGKQEEWKVNTAKWTLITRMKRNKSWIKKLLDFIGIDSFTTYFDIKSKNHYTVLIYILFLFSMIIKIHFLSKVNVNIVTCDAVSLDID